MSAVADARAGGAEGDSTVTPAQRYSLRREYPTALARAISWIPLYLLLWPLVRIMERFGRWPRAMSHRMAQMMDQAAPYTPTEHDVMVCSYFKSGTNWMMQIVTQIAHRGHAEFDHIHDLVPWLELPGRIRYTIPVSDEESWRGSPTGLRAIKTHMPIEKLVLSPAARYVWVVRDPKDVVVSGYHFVRSTALGPLMTSLDRWVDLFLSDEAFTGSWARHLAGGWRERHRDNVLFLTFESIKREPRASIGSIAAHMRVDLTPAELDAVIERSSYSYMKAHGSQFDTRGLSPPWAAPRGAMVRRGQAGGGTELLSADDRRRIDDHCRAELARLGSDFPYDECYG